jgi:hypothetical protein
MDDEIARAKEVLEKEGYIVALPLKPKLTPEAFWLRDNYVAFRLDPDYDSLSSDGQLEGPWVSPDVFCLAIGISRHTLTRRLKDKNCPVTKQMRGPKGRLIRLIPNQSLVHYLRRFKK